MTITPLSTPLASALAYRARGWSLIPVQRREKKPFVAWKHHQSTLPTNEEIERWWSQYPDANIGIVTGRISDLIVVDIDTGADISGLHLPPTYTVRSGGGGYHMYYRYPQSFEGYIETKAGIREHVDIRADGGLIVAPPSLHASGKHYTVDESCPSIDEIAEAPEWILEECMKGGQGQKNKTNTKIKTEGNGKNAKATKNTTDWKIFLEEKNGEGTRNDRTTKYVGKILASLPEELWDTAGWSSVQTYNASNNTPPLDEHELSEIFASVRTMASENGKNGGDSEKGESSEKRGVADTLLDLILPEVTLFKNQTNDGFIRVRCEDHFENLAIASKSCKQWLTRRYYSEYGSSLSPDTLSRVVNTLSAQAEYQGEQHVLDIRIVGDTESIRYDIGSPSWECVSVDPFGWRVVPGDTIAFRRYTLYQPQVIPLSGGDQKSLLELFDFLNIREEDQLLVLVYIISLFMPFIAHPVALLHGDRGSAKSTFGKVVKKLVDPAKPDIFSFPSNKDDLVRTLNKSYYTVFDNLSHITADASDTLCRAVTGEGYTKRTLFTDDDDTVFEFRRAVCLNGINLVSERPDLLDRSIIIELQRIPESRRMPESEFWKKFDERLPHILGSIFDTVSQTLAIYPTIHPKKLFRMADFTKAGMAIAKALGYEEEDFIRAYSENIKKQNTSVIDNDIVANTIVRFMEFQNMWKGSPTDLHSQLSALAGVSGEGRNFPKSASSLGKRLNIVTVNLKDMGIIVTQTNPAHRGRMIEIRKDASFGHEENPTHYTVQNLPSSGSPRSAYPRGAFI